MHSLGQSIIGHEPDHPANAGLTAWFVAPAPTDGGRVFPDVTGLTAGAAMAPPAAWSNGALTLGGATVARTAAFGQDGPLTLAGWFIGTGLTFFALGADNGSNGRGWAILNQGGSVGYLRCGVAFDATAGPIPTDGRPYHVAATRTAAGTTTYLNGQQLLTYTGAFNALWASDPMTLHGIYDQNTGLPNTGYSTGPGLLLSVRTHGSVLSAAQIAADYQTGPDQALDPRFRRTSPRSLFVTAAGVPTTCYVPAFAGGIGW